MAGSQDNSGPGGSNDVQGPGSSTEQISASPQTPEAPAIPPAGSAPASETPPATPPDGGQASEAQPARVDWRDRRIGELTARTREVRAEIDRLRGAHGQEAPNGATARAPNGQFQQPAGYQGPPNQAEIDRQVEQRANI